MRLRLITQPGPALTLDEAKAQCRVDGAEDDTLLTALVTAAGAHVERIAGRAFGAQTWEMVLDAFPGEPIAFGWGPVASITSVTYRNGADVETTLAPDAYLLEAAGDPGRLLSLSDWPTAYDRSGAVVVRYVAGMGWTEEAKMAVRLLVAAWYANREAVGERREVIPLAFDALVGGLRRMSA